jgi:hypothetical protein
MLLMRLAIVPESNACDVDAPAMQPAQLNGDFMQLGSQLLTTL